jgi:hypothetical protein
MSQATFLHKKQPIKNVYFLWNKKWMQSVLFLDKKQTNKNVYFPWNKKVE